VQEAEWEAKEAANFAQFEKGGDDASDVGWGIPKDNPRRKAWIESDSKVSVSYPASHRGWPCMTGGIEVSIEVHSDLQDSEEDRPACRLLVLIDCLFSLKLRTGFGRIGTGPCDTTAPSTVTWMPIYGRLGTRRLGTAFLCISL
jgi:hypothetical protein